MASTRRVDAETPVVGFDGDLAAGQNVNEHDLGEHVEGMTFGVVTMSENAPHAGERRLAGDEVLYSKTR